MKRQSYLSTFLLLLTPIILPSSLLPFQELSSLPLFSLPFDQALVAHLRSLLPLPHGLSVRLTASINVFVLHSLTAWLPGDHDGSCDGGGGHPAIDLMKCVVVDLVLPVYLVTISMGFHLSNHFVDAGVAFSLIVLVTPTNLPLLDSISAIPSTHPLNLPLLTHPSLPTGVEHIHDLPLALAAALIHNLSLNPDVLR